MGSICSSVSPNDFSQKKRSIDSPDNNRNSKQQQQHHHHHDHQQQQQQQHPERSLSNSTSKRVQSINNNNKNDKSINLTSCPRLPFPKSIQPSIRIDKRKMEQKLEQEDIFRRAVSKIGFHTLKQRLHSLQQQQQQTKHRTISNQSIDKQQQQQQQSKLQQRLSKSIQCKKLSSSSMREMKKKQILNKKSNTNKSNDRPISKKNSKFESIITNTSSATSFNSQISILSVKSKKM